MVRTTARSFSPEPGLPAGRFHGSSPGSRSRRAGLAGLKLTPPLAFRTMGFADTLTLPSLHRREKENTSLFLLFAGLNGTVVLPS